MRGFEVEIAQVAEYTWQVYVGFSIRAKEVADEPSGSDMMSGRINIDGVWTGAVVVTCGRELARSAAASLFSLEPEQVSEEEIVDVLGEIANIVAGNLQSRLPGPSELSPPVVSRELPTSSRACGPRAHVAFDCDGEPLWVHIQ